ncbi:hypothetical protein RN001_014869 [Aquatica leii]|uniref:Uncharacterized protein n=1 Tax=Aquatica leii TaxID=1421715 RepID=A0AAN7PYW4_9COLE|nr:hypothetical protein RN001_014869 [Aquatica leii]
MAQFVTHIQPTLMEASHHHGPHYYKECHKDLSKGKMHHKEPIGHHKTHHDDLESHIKDVQKHQGHPRDFPVLPKEHHPSHHEDPGKAYAKQEHGHHSKSHHNGLKESRSQSEDSGLYIDSHGIPHSYQLHFIDGQGIHRDAEGHALDEYGRTSAEILLDNKSQQSHHHGEKEVAARPQHIDLHGVHMENKGVSLPPEIGSVHPCTDT